jgi:hypothetical protein
MTDWYANNGSSGANRIQIYIRGGTYATNQSDWNAVIDTYGYLFHISVRSSRATMMIVESSLSGESWYRTIA